MGEDVAAAGAESAVFVGPRGCRVEPDIAYGAHDGQGLDLFLPAKGESA